MFKISEIFFKKLQKQENYWILRAEEEEIILGTNLNVKTAINLLGNIFQPQYNKVVDRTYPIFFLLTTLDKSKDLRGEFEKKKLPVKKLDKDLMNGSAEKIKEILDEFISEHFNL